MTRSVGLPSAEKNRSSWTPNGSGFQLVVSSTVSAPVLDGSSEGWVADSTCSRADPKGMVKHAHHREGSLDTTGIGRVKWVFPALRKDEREANLRVPTCPS